MIKYVTVSVLALVLSAAMAARASTLTLRNGQQFQGNYLGGTQDEIQFQVNGQVKIFKTADVASIDFDSSAGVASNPAVAPTANPAPGANVASAAAAPMPNSPAVIGSNQAGLTQMVTVPQGSSVTVRMIDSVDSSVNKPGDVFHASLEDALVVGDVVVAKKDADVYGKLIQVQSAGRLTGKSELELQLTGIRAVNGTIQPIVSGDYQAAGKSRTGQSAEHGLGGAALGAIIGAVAGGGGGAAKGAVIGGAAGTGVTMVTKGEQVKVPSETLLQFQLSQPVTITLPKSSS
jgi:hypothetical protein